MEKHHYHRFPDRSRYREDSEEANDGEAEGSSDESTSGVSGTLPSREGSASGSADFSALEDY